MYNGSFRRWAKREDVCETPSRDGRGKGRTVSLSQLIHLGIIMLARLKAKAFESLVSEFRCKAMSS